MKSEFKGVENISMYANNRKQMGLENLSRDDSLENDVFTSSNNSALNAPRISLRNSGVHRTSQRELYVSKKDVPSYDDLRSSRMVSFICNTSLFFAAFQ